MPMPSPKLPAERKLKFILMPRDPDEGKIEPTDITYGNESARDEFKSRKCDSLNAMEPPDFANYVPQPSFAIFNKSFVS